MKKILKLIFSRAFILGIIFLAQLSLFIYLTYSFTQSFVWFYGVNLLLSLVITIAIINNKSNPAYKIAWIVPVFIFPIFGAIFYIFFSENRIVDKIRENMDFVLSRFKNAIERHENVIHQLVDNPDAYIQSYYIENISNCPVFPNEGCKYYSSGEEFYPDFLEKLENAKKFIFLEFFIIEEGYLWCQILDILERKAKQGLDVRVIYDDVGCIAKLPRNYYKKLRQKGIKSHVFNPVKYMVMPKHNNRDHRKIAVIDGHYAFTGGINLADEYINHIEKFGYWKDTAIMLHGKPVWSLTVMFLSLWSYFDPDADNDFNDFLPPVHFHDETKNGYVQPFTDSPLDNEPIGETVYLNMINRAKSYLYITTPYLIISNEMLLALCNASKSGIDVKIITPNIPDKAYVQMVTRSYYQQLLESGVEIYEYTPGFIHSKNFVSDDQYGVVGSINLDFRSLYLHFESAVWLYNCEAVMDIKHDFLDTLTKSRNIDLSEAMSVSLPTQLVRSILKIFAPMM